MIEKFMVESLPSIRLIITIMASPVPALETLIVNRIINIILIFIGW